MNGAYKTLREEAFEANMEIPQRNLAIYTWGNVSAFDSDKGVFAIKPSGVKYEKLKPEDIVVLDLEGKTVEGKLKPSSDTGTHLILYQDFINRAVNSSSGGNASGGKITIKGICHTHSTHAVSFAQARQSVPVYGTTHADHGACEIPCTEIMGEEAVKGDYEIETGKLIVETFNKQAINPLHMPMILVAGHGPFTWGESASQSVYNAAVLEEVCKMALLTRSLDPNAKTLPEYIINKHWERKHGPNAYYGQK